MCAVGGIRRALISVMPVSAGRIVLFKYMNVVACMGELPIGNEPTEDLNDTFEAQYIIPKSCTDDDDFVDGPFKSPNHDKDQRGRS
jgi:hypothetical protein